MTKHEVVKKISKPVEKTLLQKIEECNSHVDFFHMKDEIVKALQEKSKK